MKGLTVRQPWAHAIAYLGKDVENRGRGALGWRHRGPLAIVAGLGWSDRGAVDPRILAEAQESLLTNRPEDRAAGLDARRLTGRISDLTLARGTVVGIVDVVDVHPSSVCGCSGDCSPWGEAEYVRASGEVETDPTHLVLDNPTPVTLPPNLSVKGFLGIRELPADVSAVLEAVIR